MEVKRREHKRQESEESGRLLPLDWFQMVKRDVFSLEDRTSVETSTYLSISDDTKVDRRQRYFSGSEDKTEKLTHQEQLDPTDVSSVPSKDNRKWAAMLAAK